MRYFFKEPAKLAETALLGNKSVRSDLHSTLEIVQNCTKHYCI